MECHYLKFSTQPDVFLTALPRFCSVTTSAVSEQWTLTHCLSQQESPRLTSLLFFCSRFTTRLLGVKRKGKKKFVKFDCDAAGLFFLNRVCRALTAIGSSGPPDRPPRQGRAKAANKLNACLDWRDRIRSAPLIVSGSRCKFSLEAECASESRRLVRMR